MIPRKGLLSEVIEEIVSPIINANKRFKDKSNQITNFFLNIWCVLFQFRIT